MISAITTILPIQPTQKQNRQISFCRIPIAHDTVSFSQNNLLAKPSEEITQAVLSAKKDPKNYIGQGTEGIVYKIPDTNYCVKFPHKGSEDMGKWSKTIYPQQEVNHIVAKSENNTVIMKYIDGESLFWGHEPKEIYSLPKQSYINLLKQLTDAHKKYMVFDNTPANIIYNVKDKSLTAIDFYNEDSVEPRSFCPLSNVFSCIKAKGNTPENKSDNRKLCGKLLNLVIDELMSDKPQEFAVRKEDVIKMMEALRWSQRKDIPPQFDFLEKSMCNMIDLKYSQNKTEESQKQFAGEIKYSKCIINQILSD